MDFPLAARRGKRNDGLLRLSHRHPDIGRADMNSDRSPQRLTQPSGNPRSTQAESLLRAPFPGKHKRHIFPRWSGRLFSRISAFLGARQEC